MKKKGDAGGVLWGLIVEGGGGTLWLRLLMDGWMHVVLFMRDVDMDGL